MISDDKNERKLMWIASFLVALHAESVRPDRKNFASNPAGRATTTANHAVEEFDKFNKQSEG